MTLEEIRNSNRDILYPDDVAEFLEVQAQSIRNQAHENPKMLGFNVCVIGNKVKIPRKPFIDFWEGDNK